MSVSRPSSPSRRPQSAAALAQQQASLMEDLGGGVLSVFVTENNTTANRLFELLHALTHWQLSMHSLSDKEEYIIWRSEDTTGSASYSAFLPDSDGSVQSFRLSLNASLPSQNGQLGQITLHDASEVVVRQRSSPITGSSSAGSKASTMSWTILLPKAKTWVLVPRVGQQLPLSRIILRYPEKGIGQLMQYHEMMAAAYPGWSSVAKGVHQMAKVVCGNTSSARTLIVSDQATVNTVDQKVRQYGASKIECSCDILVANVASFAGAFKSCASLNELLLVGEYTSNFLSLVPKLSDGATSRLRVLTIQSPTVTSEMIVALMKHFNQESIDGCSVRELDVSACQKWDRYCDTQLLMLISAGCIRHVRRKTSATQDSSSIDTALQCSFDQRNASSRQFRRLIGDIPSEIEGLKVQIRFASVSYYAPYETFHRCSAKIKDLLKSGVSVLTVDLPAKSYVEDATITRLISFTDQCVGTAEFAEIQDERIMTPLHTLQHENVLRHLVGGREDLRTHCRIAMMIEIATLLEMPVVVRILRSHLVLFVTNESLLRELVVRGRAQRMKDTFAALLS